MSFNSNISRMFALTLGMMACLGVALPAVAPDMVDMSSEDLRLKLALNKGKGKGKRDTDGYTEADTDAYTDADTNTDAVVGKATVHNACPFSIYSNIVHGAQDGTGLPEEIYQVLEPNETVSHAFSHDPGVGVSWKIWRQDEDTDNWSPIQLEYTWITDSKRTWYDLSMIDAGEPDWLEESDEEIVADADGYGEYTGSIGIRHSFQEHGITLTPHVDGEEVAEGNCLAVQCPAGEEFCLGAYNTWNDWAQQHDCEEGVDLKLVLCG
ncbi:hypothetical protein A1O3_07481 [Capronia epimyces CBS 606.96]|uniref:Uncharacterized protein n=1 Tax=Capronia epimyces CBS 606.96 TaxID=1182542 RepID=W9XW08_9EURO|nr:uncharacterized protein A1O3_07481 [Capronia epimyces CBS 606.96]EXJ81191.1 hypothetical protein A1O3_07481 [Capronia epimyces CBS 606.96]